MVFKRLEEEVTKNEKDMRAYLEVFSELQEPTKTVLGYVLDVGETMHTSGLGDKYAVFGGYGVLSHLMDVFGASVAKVWRGSSDIDMAGDAGVYHAIRANYGINSDMPSPNLARKRTIKLTEDDERECKVDFYLGNPQEKYGVSRVNTHFGVPLRVISAPDLIKGKLNTPEHEFQHAGDIMAMLAVCEKREMSPEEIVRYFDAKQGRKLTERVKLARKVFERDRLGFFPNGDYIQKVEQLLRRKRAVR
jgi:hypothetical protein